MILNRVSRRLAVLTSRPKACHRSCYRGLSIQKPKNSGDKTPITEEKLTREEVDAIAERARNDQRIWDTERKLFGGGIGWGHPLFFLLAGGAALLHYINGQRDEKLEQNEKHLERLKQRRLEKKPMTRTELDSLLAHKKRQLFIWQSKAASADPVISEDARNRLAKLQDEIAELEFTPPPPPAEEAA